MDGAAQRMLDRRKRRLDSSVVGVLLAAAVSVLPMCDACDDAADADVFADLGMSSSGPSALWPCVLWFAIGTAIVLVVGKLAHRAEGIALVLLGVVVAGAMVYSSSAKIARTRSNAVDSWETCFHTTSLDSYGAEYGPTMGPNDRSSFDGPHQAFTGEPCEESEHRTDHRHEHPDGDVADGLHQISYRFPEDRTRVIYLPILLLLGLVVALVLVAALRRARPAGPNPLVPP